MKISEIDDESIIAEINITPLTDIFLVLLIIFMISSSAIFEGGLNVKLPQAKGSKITAGDFGKPVNVTVSKDGKISVNDKILLSESELKNVLENILNGMEEKLVVIRGDESIFLGKAVEIMNTAKNAGAEKIAIATRPPEKK